MKLREQARIIFDEAVRAADPYDAVSRAVSMDDSGIFIAGVHYPADLYRRIVVVGAGKASARMGRAIEDSIGGRIDDGWINTKYEHAEKLSRIRVHECGHPVPDENGVAGVREIMRLLESAEDGTLVIALISGGGSALAPAPADGITLAEKQDVTRMLLNAGASIGELNTVRKHLSALKGGGMARLAHPARLHVLILSDVIGDRLDTIASGPAAPDSGTFGDALSICERRGILEKLPHAVRHRLLDGAAGKVPETAKTGDSYLDGAVNTIVGNNSMSVNAARDKARELGFNTLLLTTVLEGEASEAGTFLACLASEIQATGNPVPPPACIIAGGETTVTVTGDGKGGRNQELALSAAVRLSGMDNVALLSGGTDGTDGPTDAAGGIVDGETLARGAALKLDADDYLKRNDSYHYLDAVGGLVRTGPTGTNVMDIQILLAGETEKG